MTDPNRPVVVDGLAGMRRSVGLTQAQVAQRMGVTQQSVNRMEGSWPNIRVNSLVAFAKACGGEVSFIADFGYRQLYVR